MEAGKLFLSQYLRVIILLVFSFDHFTASVPLVDFEVNNTISLPAGKENCKCSWSEWMNSGGPDESGDEEETYSKLRTHGYNFCAVPVDIQCLNSATKSLALGDFARCEVLLGLSCKFFCDDFYVRVACCYCPPSAIGPEFLIESQGSGGCLSAGPTTAANPHTIIVSPTCSFSDKAQSWVWVSKYVLMNVKTLQCLAYVNSLVMLEDCELNRRKQKWRYLERSMLLQLYETSTYLATKDGKLLLLSSKSSDSTWRAKVEEGETSMKNMRNPKCRPMLQAPDNGSSECTLSNYVSSKCTFTCEFGFQLQEGSEETSTCTDDSEFTSETPVCERITCNPVLSAVDHGTVTCSNENYLDSSCIFQCDPGFFLLGSRQLVCKDAGNWNHDLPVCRRVTCSPDLKAEGVQDGLVNCTNGVFHNSKCTYVCHEGFELIGPPARICLVDETWDETKPVCQKMECKDILAPKSGHMSCNAKFDYASICRFTCDVGYTLMGSTSATCSAEKTWSSETPECRRKTCNTLKPPSHGKMKCDDLNYYSSSCSFSCNEGYKIDGEQTLKCTDEGWDNGAPICSQIVCGRLFNPANGLIKCSDSDLFGSTCTFSCARGFKIAGARVSVKCREDGWNYPAPVCEKITCPVLSTVKNGQTFCTNFNNYDSNCIVTCDNGYEKPPDSPTGLVKCQIDGSWTRPLGICKRIQCRFINELHQGYLTCNDMNNFNSTCVFECKEGFNLLGAKQATCTSSGWDAQTPNCGRLTCSLPLARPSNGQIKCNTSGRPVCTFSCNKGHQLLGKKSSECQQNETWSVTEIPICKIIECPTKPVAPNHGSVTCNSAKVFGSVCTFSCDKGFELAGEAGTQCLEDRTWENPTPTCQKITCPAIQDPVNGEVKCRNGIFYQSKCTFHCNEGYQLTGSSATECMLNSTWTASVPYCELMTCSPSYSNPSNGLVDCTNTNNYASICQFDCEEGFSIEGATTSKCLEKGWTMDAPPTCRKITCPANKSELENGSERCELANEFKSVCHYTCNNGYEILGPDSTQCTKTGVWSKRKPVCRKVKCPKIPKIKHGQVICDKGNVFGSKCYFLCNDDFVKTQDDQGVSCMGNRRWYPVGFPTCEPENVTAAMTPVVTTQSTTSRKAKVSTVPTTTTPTHTRQTNKPKGSVGNEKPHSTVSLTSAEIEITTKMSAMRSTTTILPVIPQADQTTASNQGQTGKETLNYNTTTNAIKEGTQAFPIMIVLSVIGAIILILVALLIFFCLKKRKSKGKQTSKQRTSSLIYDTKKYDHTELGPLISNGNGSIQNYGPISMDRLEMEYNRKHADDDKLFREEYHSLNEGTGTKEAGGRAQNKEKNRYTNILPYDHSRVILPKVRNQSDSDYINASFVDGYKHKGKFIAAQGPKENTIYDFWRMMWEQNVSTIIMATNLEERKENKCARYWPITGTDTYGDVTVSFLGENHLVDYTIRQFAVQQAQGNSTLSSKRTVTQYHFTGWPDFGVPKSPSGILKFLRKIKHGSPTGYGPIVVHCSAGVGRTGTFICIDGMMDMISRENKIDVFTFAAQMRQQRPEMVQTEQQYIFIYQAILEHHLYGDTEVEASEVNAHIEDLLQRLPGNITGMEHEFKKLTSIRIQKEHMRAGNHPANMKKNRVLLILPYDWNRVILPIKRGQENTDYINASYIDGYRQKDAYIATQGPLPHTIEDFWRMIWDSGSGSIVMLTELLERGQVKCAQYWPNDGFTTYGTIRVEVLSTKENEFYSERDFKIINTLDGPDGGRQQYIKQFHYHGWPEVGTPVSGYSMIELVEAVQRQQQTSGNHPMVIHCSAGAGRTGTFCALSTALEQVKAEGVLDIFQIVKCLRMQRPHMVQNLEQYEFCYRAVQEYIDSMSEYYNFK